MLVYCHRQHKSARSESSATGQPQEGKFLMTTETVQHTVQYAVLTTADTGETFFAGRPFNVKADAESHAKTISTWIRQMEGMGGKMTLPTGDDREVTVVGAEVVLIGEGAALGIDESATQDGE